MKTSPNPASPVLLELKSYRALAARENFPGMNSSDRAPHEEILHEAYAIWEREGHPADRQLANWLEAEGDVMSRR